jgi:hypothetical protein
MDVDRHLFDHRPTPVINPEGETIGADKTRAGHVVRGDHRDGTPGTRGIRDLRRPMRRGWARCNEAGTAQRAPWYCLGPKPGCCRAIRP